MSAPVDLRPVADFFGLPGDGTGREGSCGRARDHGADRHRCRTFHPGLRRRHRARPGAQNRPAHVRGCGLQTRPDTGGAGEPQRASSPTQHACGIASRRHFRPPASPSIRKLPSVRGTKTATRSFSSLYTADGAGEGLRPTIQIELKHTRASAAPRHAAGLVIRRGGPEPRA